jgi:hypothetical protein
MLLQETTVAQRLGDASESIGGTKGQNRKEDQNAKQHSPSCAAGNIVTHGDFKRMLSDSGLYETMRAI